MPRDRERVVAQEQEIEPEPTPQDTPAVDRRVTWNEEANTEHDPVVEPFEEPEPAVTPPSKAVESVKAQRDVPKGYWPLDAKLPIKLLVLVTVAYVVLQFIAPHISGARFTNPYVRNLLVSVLIAAAGVSAQKLTD